MAKGWSALRFFALVDESGTDQPYRIATSQPLQRQLKKLFDDQADEFFAAGITQVPFDGRYLPDSSEVFQIEDFALPGIIEQSISDSNSVPLLQISARNPPKIKSVYAGEVHSATDSVYGVFQDFNSSRLLVKARTLLLTGNTFQVLTDGGLTLADRSEAVFDGDSLYFRSFYKTNRFLDLSSYFHDATDAEIKTVLSHERLAAEDENVTIDTADQWMRRRFGIIQQTGILDLVTPRKIREAAPAECKDLRVDIRRVGGKEAIVFPANKKAAKELLTFLCEGYFHGELTRQLYKTNSQRAVN
jgi:hypothetical protein